MSKQTRDNWNVPDDGMKTAKESDPSRLLRNFLDNPEKNKKANTSMKGGNEIYSRGSLQNNGDNQEDTIMVKGDMRVRRKLVLARSCLSDHNAPEKES